MAIRGRKPRPEFLRYYDAGVEPSVYLIDAGQFIKVGKAHNPAKRLKNLHVVLARDGLAIQRFTAFMHDDWTSLYRAEQECIRALAAVASNVGTTREYFTGITYEAALDVVRGVLQPA